jgi:Tfp pilus assembly protein PilF
MKNIGYIMLLSLCFIACNNEPKQAPITNSNDYNKYLEQDAKASYKAAITEKKFWSNRLGADSTGIGDLGPLAGAYTRIFQTGGAIENLKKAEALYNKAIAVASPILKDSYVRALAHNYISQHRFKEANAMLEKSYAGPSNKHATELMLFDSYMEIGAYNKANEVLIKLKNNSDYNYLIRVAKWSDHNGDLDAAIRYLEKARDIAESRDSKPLKIWTYSNIADFYGHDGNIKASYDHYLKTLELQPDNAYVKKGIVWILYSKERNTKEANRILDTLIKNHNIPDYYLLKAEMAEFENDQQTAEKYTNKFLEATDNEKYGGMYNTYKIEVLVNSNPTAALQLAKAEVKNRATPETYHLLALAQLKNGLKTQALQTIEQHVANKSPEPMALFHSAMVYKANGLSKKVRPLKELLLEASYELGPVIAAQVAEL